MFPKVMSRSCDNWIGPSGNTSRSTVGRWRSQNEICVNPSSPTRSCCFAFRRWADAGSGSVDLAARRRVGSSAECDTGCTGSNYPRRPAAGKLTRVDNHRDDQRHSLQPNEFGVALGSPLRRRSFRMPQRILRHGWFNALTSPLGRLRRCLLLRPLGSGPSARPGTRTNTRRRQAWATR